MPHFVIISFRLLGGVFFCVSVINDDCAAVYGLTDLFSDLCSTFNYIIFLSDFHIGHPWIFPPYYV